MIKEYTLKSFAKGALRVEDKCAVMRLASSCLDELEATRFIYEVAGRA